MENSVQSNPVSGSSPVTTSNGSNLSVPSIDLKAPLKIETAEQEEAPPVDYGKKLFLFGVIFGGIIVICATVIAFLWIQNTTQVQKPITVEQNK